MKTKTTIYVMCAKSDSGDDYCSTKAWDHKPSSDEINEVRVKLDSVPFDSKNHSENDQGFVVLNNKKYISYINSYQIKKIIL